MACLLLPLHEPIPQSVLLSACKRACLCGGCRLQHLYVRTAASPIPRPLIVHFPHKTKESLIMEQELGHIKDVRALFLSTSCYSGAEVTFLHM